MVVARGTALPYPPPVGLASDDSTGEVTVTAAQLAAETGADTDRARRVLEAASEMAVRYAPDAPTALLNEAVIRCGGYLLDQPADARRSETTGAVSTSWAATHTSALRHSGAMALLSPYKARRAGAIG